MTKETSPMRGKYYKKYKIFSYLCGYELCIIYNQKVDVLNEAGDKMADIRENGWEWFHYDNPDFQVQFRRNFIPAGTIIRDIKSIHWHDDIELIYVLKGATHYEMAKETIKMKAGEGIFVNSRSLHLIHPDENEDCELLCLIFHPVIMCTTQYVTDNYVKPIIDNKDIQYVHLNNKVSWQKQVLDDIAGMERFCEEERGHMKVMNYIFDLWEQLYDNLMDTCSVEDNKTNQDLSCIKNMIFYIHKNYRDKIKLTDICSAGNVGKSKCTVLFEKYYNVSPIEYVKNYRIEQGARLLTLSDMPITEIAYEIGFTDGSYFSKAFTEKVGITPIKYRRIGREMSSYYELPQSQGL